MTSSPDARVVRGAVTTPLLTPDLRTGTWTRLGGGHVRGDASTELLLGTLADRTRVAARSEGFSVGWAEGHRAATLRATEIERQSAAARLEIDAAHEQEHREALAALRLTVARLEAAIADARTTVASQASELALALTEELVGHALLTEGDADAVHRAVLGLPDGRGACVRLNPSVATSPAAGELRDLGVRVVADPTVGRGNSVVELDDQVLSIDIGSALERLREVLA